MNFWGQNVKNQEGFTTEKGLEVAISILITKGVREIPSIQSNSPFSPGAMVII